MSHERLQQEYLLVLATLKQMANSKGQMTEDKVGPCKRNNCKQGSSLLGAAVEGLGAVACLRRVAAAEAGLVGGAGLPEMEAAGTNLVLPCCTKV